MHSSSATSKIFNGLLNFCLWQICLAQSYKTWGILVGIEFPMVKITYWKTWKADRENSNIFKNYLLYLPSASLKAECFSLNFCIERINKARYNKALGHILTKNVKVFKSFILMAHLHWQKSLLAIAFYITEFCICKTC
jgi:hypothetical protein